MRTFLTIVQWKLGTGKVTGIPSQNLKILSQINWIIIIKEIYIIYINHGAKIQRFPFVWVHRVYAKELIIIIIIIY